MDMQDLYLMRLKFVAQLYNQDTFSLQSPRTSDIEAGSEKVSIWISKIPTPPPNYLEAQFNVFAKFAMAVKDFDPKPL